MRRHRRTGADVGIRAVRRARRLRQRNPRSRNQRHLARRRRQIAIVIDVMSHQQDQAVGTIRGDRGAFLNLYVGLARGHRQGSRTSQPDCPPPSSPFCKKFWLRIAIVLGAAAARGPAESCRPNIDGGGDQRTHIDLRRAAEDDAVLVDHQDRAVGLDVAENLTRRGAVATTRLRATQLVLPC